MTGVAGVEIESEHCFPFFPLKLRKAYEDQEPADCIIECSNGSINISKFGFWKSDYYIIEILNDILQYGCLDTQCDIIVFGDKTVFDCSEYRREAIILYTDVLHEMPMVEYTSLDLLELAIFLLEGKKSESTEFEEQLLQECVRKLAATSMSIRDTLIL